MKIRSLALVLVLVVSLVAGGVRADATLTTVDHPAAVANHEPGAYNICEYVRAYNGWPVYLLGWQVEAVQSGQIWYVCAVLSGGYGWLCYRVVVTVGGGTSWTDLHPAGGTWNFLCPIPH